MSFFNFCVHAEIPLAKRIPSYFEGLFRLCDLRASIWKCHLKHFFLRLVRECSLRLHLSMRNTNASSSSWD